MDGTAAPIDELIGVYDADSTLRGEIAYWLRARLRRHCELCVITHGARRAKPEWVRLSGELPASFVAYHRDELPEAIAVYGRGELPVILARAGARVRVILDRGDIAGCASSPRRLAEAITARVSSGVGARGEE
jgi:pyruvate/2-oxoglutarate dehydrogenase complex dihydrolipoamide dehydrogenase (E3) component